MFELNNSLDYLLTKIKLIFKSLQQVIPFFLHSRVFFEKIHEKLRPPKNKPKIIYYLNKHKDYHHKILIIINTIFLTGNF